MKIKCLFGKLLLGCVEYSVVKEQKCVYCKCGFTKPDFVISEKILLLLFLVTTKNAYGWGKMLSTRNDVCYKRG